MKKNMKRVALAGAVSMAVGATAVSTAQADALMFPYVVSSPSVTTILSVVGHNAGAALTGTAKRTDLHYENWHKNSVSSGLDPNDNELGCLEFDYTVPTTPEDLVTYDVSDYFGAPLNVLHNDKTDYDDFDFGRWEPIAPSRGFILVDDLIGTGEELTGEAMVYEIVNGAAWGYEAFNSLNNDFVDPTFRDGQDRYGEVIRQDGLATSAGADNENDQFVFQPLDEWTTTFLVTPVGDTTQRFGALAVGVDLQTFSNTLAIVAFDRDENPISGSTPVDVVCVGRVDVQDLISDGVESLLINGGWSVFEVVPHTLPGATPISTDGQAVQQANGAVVYKLEFNGTGVTTFNDEAISGTVNTAIQFRSDEDD